MGGNLRESEIIALLGREASMLENFHRAAFEAIRVQPYVVPSEQFHDQRVLVVAEYQKKVLYWSPIEEGWELAPLTRTGSISELGCSQFNLSQILHQLFGAEEK